MNTAGPLYIARDNLLGVDLSGPVPSIEAGRIATAATVAAGRIGERVTAPGGTDRFTTPRAPMPPVPPVTYSYLEAEAMLCAWEALLDQHHRAVESRAVREAWKACGAVQMRHHAMALGPFIVAVYDAIPTDVRDAGHSYDWEIVPASLDQVEWDEYRPGHYTLPDIKKATAAVAAVLA